MGRSPPRLQAMPGRIGSMAGRVAAMPKVADPFYQSAGWRRLVEARRLDADYFAARKRLKSGERLILDHVIEIKDGGAALDPANTQWLTFGEHQAKTAAARAKRARGER